MVKLGRNFRNKLQSLCLVGRWKFGVEIPSLFLHVPMDRQEVSRVRTMEVSSITETEVQESMHVTPWLLLEGKCMATKCGINFSSDGNQHR